MKKLLLSIAVLCAAFAINAQGVWKAPAYGAADGDVITLTAGAELVTGITGLYVTHNFTDPALNKGDADAPVVVANGVTWDNKSILQAANTNGDFFILVPSTDGTLSVACKLGGNKKTFVAETTDAAAQVATYGAFAANLFDDDIVYPVVTSVGVALDGSALEIPTQSWDNSTAINTTSENQYIVLTFSVTGGKTYVVGCSGSKFMLRGIAFTSTASVPSVNGVKEIKSVQYFNILGEEVSASTQGLVLVKTKYVDGETSVAKIYKK